MVRATFINNVWIMAWSNGATLFIDTASSPAFYNNTECYSVKEIAEKYNLTPVERKQLQIDLYKTF